MHRKHAVTSAIGWSGKSRCKAVFPVGYANDGIKSVMIFTDPSTVRSSGVRKEYYQRSELVRGAIKGLLYKPVIAL